MDGDGQSREREEAARPLQMFGGMSRLKSIHVGSGRGEYVFVIHDKEWIKEIGNQCNVRDDAGLSSQDA